MIYSKSNEAGWNLSSVLYEEDNAVLTDGTPKSCALLEILVLTLDIGDMTEDHVP